MARAFYCEEIMTVKIKFNKTYVLPTDGITYEEGKVYDIEETPGSVDRWLKRGCTLVEEVKEEEKVKEEKVVDEVKEVEEAKEDKPVKPRRKTTRRTKK